MSFLSSLTNLQLISLVLLVIGTVGTLLTPYRYLVGFLVAGVLYWLGIEVLQSVVAYVSSASLLTTYVVAIAISLIPLCAWLLATEGEYRSKSFRQSDKYIEHTPLYDRTVPTSKG